MSRCAIALAALALVACSKRVSPPPTIDGGEATSSPSPRASDAGTRRIPTTSWSIASGNVDGDIAERLKRNEGDATSRALLVSLLLGRAQTLARIADYETAEEIAKKSLAASPDKEEAHRSIASVHAALHRFVDAKRELDEAERLRAPKHAIAVARGNIALALGDYGQAATLFADAPATEPTDITTRAVLAGRMQQTEEAERLFESARNAVVDVSPYPVAWIAFQRGSYYEARGEDVKARAHYEEALQAVPVHAHAAVHLAAMEPADKAIVRLETLRTTSDDPEVLAALATAHKRAGHDRDAKRLTDEARVGYVALLAKHPAAFADHAARFFLREGDDAPKALALAKDNAKVRATEEAIDLWMGAAASAKDRREICASADAMKSLTYVTAERRRAASAVRCP